MKKYLGDAVYYRSDGYGVTLTTENGFAETNRIYLESEVIGALLKALGGDFDRKKMRALIGDPEADPEAESTG